MLSWKVQGVLVPSTAILLKALKAEDLLCFPHQVPPSPGQLTLVACRAGAEYKWAQSAKSASKALRIQPVPPNQLPNSADFADVFC